MSLGMMVTRLAWMAHKLVSSKETNEVSLGGLLESQHGGSLEAKITLEVLSNLTDKTLEGQLADQQVRRLLVTTDLTKSHSSWAVTVGLLDTSSRRGGLAGGLWVN
jgi:hypothetical protein